VGAWAIRVIPTYTIVASVKSKGEKPVYTFNTARSANGGGRSPEVNSDDLSRERKRRRKGFTLVEVIVVIVIIAILAAIGVPALTGYIDKAQDKKYIAMARDHFVAAHAVLDEMYATMREPAVQDLLSNPGSLSGISFSGQYLKTYRQTYISSDITQNSAEYSYTSDRYALYDRVCDMLGEERPAQPVHGGSDSNPGFWEFGLFGRGSLSVGGGSSLLNSDGGYWLYYPEGKITGKPCIMVTYKFKPPVDDPHGTPNLADGVSTDYLVYGSSILAIGTCDESAGYEVYHLIKGSGQNQLT
jgi:prepilin-type N-terminal cleavage/methylation domain-containing protein